MRPECTAAVAQVLGQAPTPAQIRNIETRLARSMRAEAAADPQAWLALPLADQLQAAAKRATTDIQAEAVLKVRRGHQQVLAVAKMPKQLDEFPGPPFEALSRAIAFHAAAPIGRESCRERVCRKESNSVVADT